MFEWNPVFNLIMEIKNNYISKFGENTLDFNTWLEKLNDTKYNNILEPLQTNQFNEFLLIRYGLAEMQESMWTNPNSIYRECRSLVIDLKREQIILTPFHKFFNVNEVEENDLYNIQKELESAKSIEITNKLDGSMQSARWYNDNIFMAGSMALDKNKSFRLADGYNKLTNNHIRMIQDNPDYTFIFEYISLKDAHVVLYTKEQEGLYLLKLRNVYIGKQLSYKDTKIFADKYYIPMTQIEDRTFNQIMKLTKEYKSSEKEGWVLDIDGHMIKLKCDDYVKLHRLLDKLSSVNVIIQNIADNKYDDMMAKIPELYKDRVSKIANIIINYKENIITKINQYYNLAPKQDKKTFMIWVDTNCTKDINAFVKCIYLQQEFNVLKKAHGRSYKKLKDLGLYENYATLFADLEE